MGHNLHDLQPTGVPLWEHEGPRNLHPNDIHGSYLPLPPGFSRKVRSNQELAVDLFVHRLQTMYKTAL